MSQPPPLSAQEIEEFLRTDFEGRLGIVGPNGGSIIGEVLETSSSLYSLSEEIVSDGKFSVAASLPGVSASASECVSALSSCLTKMLSYVTGNQVFASDVKDWEFMEDALDSLYSRIDESISKGGEDRHSRANKKSLGGESRGELSTETAGGVGSVTTARPQDNWKVDNYRAFFVPIIKEKLNAIVPLDPLIVQLQSEQVSGCRLPGGSSTPHYTFPNVYEVEIRHSLKNEIEKVNQLHVVSDMGNIAVSMDSTSVVFVDTVELLNEMISSIISLGEVAIDLEHHDVHSYRGFTCLIQLSTCENDYIVDPFKLFNDLCLMNRFTTDPKILKVLHGADMDIQWLQRDFGVYIVNMFDTGQAARVIGLSGGFGLANLLETFCKVSTNKKYQVSDWRIRPIPAEMLKYARMDTHYLLEIKNKLWARLLTMGGGGSGEYATAYGKKMLIQCLEKSAGISLKTYTEHALSDYQAECLHIVAKAPALRVGSVRSNPKALVSMHALLKWRDERAKFLDESRHYVLSNAAVLRVANALPTNVAQLLRTLAMEHNGLFPQMYIGLELGEEIMSELTSALELLDQVESVQRLSAQPTMEVIESANSPDTPRVVGKKIVSAGPGLLGKIVTIPGGVVSSVTTGSPIEIQAHNLNNDCSSKVDMKDSTHAQKQTQKIIEEMLSFLHTEGVPVEVNTSMAEEAPNTVVTGTEFVPFSGSRTEGSSVHDVLFVPTLNERKREVRAEVISSGEKNRARKTAVSESAESKALAFVEQELNLGKAPKRRK